MSWPEAEEEKEKLNASTGLFINTIESAVQLYANCNEIDHVLPLYFVILKELCIRKGNDIYVSEVPELFYNSYGYQLHVEDDLSQTLTQPMFQEICSINPYDPPSTISPSPTLNQLLHSEYQLDIMQEKLAESESKYSEIERKHQNLLEAYNKLEDSKERERPEDKLTKMLGDELTCVVCLDTLTDAVESDCCNTLCCQNCSTGLIKCPMCRLYTYWRSNAAVQRLVDKMPVKCDNKGCSSWSTRAEMKQHKEHCDSIEIACLNNECSFTAKRKDFKPHTDTCPFALIACSHCQQQMARKNVNAHETTCEERIVKCTVLGCSTKVKQKDLRDHHDVCGFILITCTHKGCVFTVQRQYLKNHLYTCGEAEVRCKYCAETTKRRLLPSHERACFADHVQCNCGEYVKKKNVKAHNKTCPEARIECKNPRCDEWIKPHDMDHHVKEECGWTIVACRWNGCDERYLRDDVQHHERTCEHRKVTCRHCGHDTTHKALDQHLKACKKARRYSPY